MLGFLIQEEIFQKLLTNCIIPRRITQDHEPSRNECESLYMKNTCYFWSPEIAGGSMATNIKPGCVQNFYC